MVYNFNTDHLIITTLLSVLLGIQSDWYKIGTELSVDQTHLDEIKHRHGDDYYSSLKDLLCDHFKVVQPYTACAALANALRSTTVGCDEWFVNKVDDIAKRYKTSSNGTLLPENTCDEGLMFRCPCQRCSLDSYLELSLIHI